MQILYRLVRFIRDPRSVEIFLVHDEPLNTFEAACPSLKSPTMTLEKLLCLKIQVYCSLVFCSDWSDLVASPSFVVRRKRLKASIAAFNIVGGDDQLRCLQWMQLVCIESWRDSNGQYAREGLDMFVEFRGRYHRMTWYDVDCLLTMFVWTEDLTYLARLWMSDRIVLHERSSTDAKPEQAILLVK